MLIQTAAGAVARQASGSSPTAPGGVFGELLDTKLMPDYYALTKLGFTFSGGTTAANATGFTGGAAGTPLIGIYNPQTSGKDLVLLEAVVGIRTTGTAAVTVDFNHWGVAQGTTAVTGTSSAPRNLYTLQAAGSAAILMLNTANTASLASNLLRPSVSVGLTAATAVTNVQLLRDEIKGEIIIPPGGYYAFGASTTTTAASIDVAVIWAEMPV